MKKRLFALLAALLLMVLVSGCALAAGYRVGDKVEDFTVTLADGTVFSLSETLAEGKPVLLNFWASWCSPCQREMPAMELACQQLEGQAAFVCLSIEESDTVEVIGQMRESLGLFALPMGLDTDASVYELFDNPDEAIPFTVVIDKNGVLCFAHAGTQTDENKFINLMNLYTDEAYSEPRIMEDFPAILPTVAAPEEAEVLAAIGAEGMTVSGPADEETWPFIVAEDGAAVCAANSTQKNTAAEFSVTLEAKAGEALAFEYAVNAQPGRQAFTVLVDGEFADIMAGTRDWTANTVSFAADGQHTVTFRFVRDGVTGGETLAAIRSVRRVTAEEAAAIHASRPQGIKTLEGTAVEFEVTQGEFRKVIITTKNGDQTMQEEDRILVSDSFTLRIRVGQELDLNYAYISDGSTVRMITDLESDETGYICTAVRTNETDQYLGNGFYVYDDIRSEEPEMVGYFHYLESEEAMNNLLEFSLQMIQAFSDADEELPEFSWSYAE